MSILIFVLVLFVLILVHEWGHYITAKKTGMRVDEFGIGFPPRLFAIKKGETEYTFNLFPIGGFVKIFGEDGVGDPSARLDEDVSEQSEGKSPSSGQFRYGKDAVGVEGKPDSSRSFTSKPKWAQALVLVAGVTMNIILAWFLFVVALTLGTQTMVDESVATDKATLVVSEVLAESPAGEAGIPRGARILQLQSGDDVLTAPVPSTFRSFTNGHEGQEVAVTYSVKNEEYTATIVPERGLDGTDGQVAVGVKIGLAEVVSTPLHKAVVESSVMVVGGLYDITVGLGKLLADAVMLRADLTSVAGPIGIVGLVGEASSFGVTSLLMFSAFISLNLAVINLLPFPALDGGRLMFVFIEAIKGSPIKASWVNTLNTIGFVLLIALMLVVTYSDITKLF